MDAEAEYFKRRQNFVRFDRFRKSGQMLCLAQKELADGRDRQKRAHRSALPE
ncbi:hypothetical protein [Desulfobulbus oralis]|uniref:hypothetical protein n=1 Tax=Desulfobulbus oralis TaxID=1986146 RepID=UPI00318324C9